MVAAYDVEQRMKKHAPHSAFHAGLLDFFNTHAGSLTPKQKAALDKDFCAKCSPRQVVAQSSRIRWERNPFQGEIARQMFDDAVDAAFENEGEGEET